MAAEGTRAPSPPPGSDPSPRTVTPVRTNQQRQSIGSQPASPVTMSREQPQPQPGLKRVDSSRTSQQQTRQPIKDAVTDVFEHSPVTNQLNNPGQLDPELIKKLTEQITEQVIKSLQASGATPTAAPLQQVQFPPPPPPPQQPQEPRSLRQGSIDSVGARFTPPSPELNREARESGVQSPSPVLSDNGSNVSHQSRGSIRSSESQGSGDTPKPYNSESTSRVPRTSFTNTRRSGTIPQEESANRGTDGYDRDRTPFRRNSKETGHDGTTRSQLRQPPTQPDNEETPLEKFWQPLFDNGNPTMRLSQFLRGLALHLIDDYEPKGSIVVTPEKMLKFLNETRVQHEHYPWEVIFGGTLTPVSMSFVFQKLLCQHHLVQDRYDRAPTVPGLTPYGFDWFMTCLIQAHPDTEFERLAKAVMNMPISNADNKSERFPKELSRRLLPAKANMQAEQRLISSLDHEPQVFATLRGTTQMPPPPSNPPPNPSNIERERQRYSYSAQPSNAVDDEDLVGPPPVQIERERQPYTAKEGTGKQYDNGRPNQQQYRQDNPQANNSKTPRTNSGIPPPAMYGSSSGPSDPVNIPQRQPHRLSTSQIPPPMSNGGYPRSARRSPPPRNSFAKSEPEFVGSMSNSQYGSNLHPTYSHEQYTPVEMNEEQMKRYRSRSRAERSGTVGSNANDDDNNGRGYPIPNRSVPVANGYEYGGGPPIGSDPRSLPGNNIHPVGSYPAQRPPLGSGAGDNRRRSMYGSSNIGLGGDGGPGTDGYGSYAGSMNGGPIYPPPPQQQPYGPSTPH